MVFKSVVGTHGAQITYEIRGVEAVAMALRRLNQDIKAGVDQEVFRQATFMEEEVKESIAGNRGEPKSVDTGRFINSVKVGKVSDEEYEVKTSVSYAGYLEHGTSKLAPRRHFGNSLDRNKVRIREAIQSAVKKEAAKFPK